MSGETLFDPDAADTPESVCRICGEPCEGDYCSEHDPATAPIEFLVEVGT